MPYMLLIHEPIGQRASRSEAQGQAAYTSMTDFAAGLQAQGLLLAAESLASQDNAARVEVRGEHTRITDGPFAEAKEMIGGFFLLNCATRDEAVAIATRCPAAQWCTVEVRGLAPCYDDAR